MLEQELGIDRFLRVYKFLQVPDSLYSLVTQGIAPRAIREVLRDHDCPSTSMTAPRKCSSFGSVRTVQYLPSFLIAIK